MCLGVEVEYWSVKKMKIELNPLYHLYSYAHGSCEPQNFQKISITH